MSKAIVTNSLSTALRLTLEYKTDAGVVGFDHVEVAPGQSEVDGKFWTDWLEQNQSWPPVVSGSISGMIYEDNDEDAPSTPAAVTQNVTMDAPVAEPEADQPQGDAEPLPVATPTTTLEGGNATDPAQGDSIQTEDAHAQEME